MHGVRRNKPNLQHNNQPQRDKTTSERDGTNPRTIPCVAGAVTSETIRKAAQKRWSQSKDKTNVRDPTTTDPDRPGAERSAPERKVVVRCWNAQAVQERSC